MKLELVQLALEAAEDACSQEAARRANLEQQVLHLTSQLQGMEQRVEQKEQQELECQQSLAASQQEVAELQKSLDKATKQVSPPFIGKLPGVCMPRRC